MNRLLVALIILGCGVVRAEEPLEKAAKSIALGMTRQEAEKRLAPAKRSNAFSMFSGGQLWEYLDDKGNKATVWYDYTDSRKGADGWAINRINPENKVISVIYNNKLLVHLHENSISNTSFQPK